MAPEIRGSALMMLTLYSLNCISVANEAQHLQSSDVKINILFVRM
jgi:hypothetical protein